MSKILSIAEENYRERMSRRFNVDDRVYFNLNGTPECQGYGTVLGLAIDYIIQQYIVLLDQPISGHKALLVQNTLMKKVTVIDEKKC